MPKVDFDSITPKTGTVYPKAFHAEMEGRSSLRFSDAYGLSQFGANITVLAPGAKSSLRHWHEQQDEMVVMLEGVATLVDDTGETLLHPGDVAAFPAGEENGHSIVNQSEQDVRFLAVGARTENDTGWYSDLDMKVAITQTGYTFTRKDGSPYSGDDI